MTTIFSALGNLGGLSIKERARLSSVLGSLVSVSFALVGPANSEEVTSYRRNGRTRESLAPQVEH
jgi:hypothetical protein